MAIVLLATLALVAGYPSILVAVAQTTCQGVVDARDGDPDHAAAHSVHATLGQASRRPPRETLVAPPFSLAALTEAASLPFAPRCWPQKPPSPVRGAAQPTWSNATAPRGPPAA